MSVGRSVEDGVSGGLVVVDPGTTTGVCVVRDGYWRQVKGRREWALEYLRKGREDGYVQTYELDAHVLGLEDVASCLADECERVRAAVTVHEDFILRTDDMRRATLDPIRVTSGFCAVWKDRNLGDWNGLRFVSQQPSDMKTQFGGKKTDKRGLAGAGLWVVGSAHERDAMGHAALFLTKGWKASGLG